MEQQDVIRKIQKLLSLGQSPNEAEASLAMARAQELLAKYNLDFAMVNAAQVPGGANEPVEAREKAKVSRSAQYQWQRDLWKAIAEANFCFYAVVAVYEGKRGTKQTTSRIPVKRHMIIGRQSNVIAVRLMGEYLEDTMESLVIKVGGYTNQERMSRGANSWKRGCADRLVQRINDESKARQAKDDAGGASTAIALRDVHRAEYESNYDFLRGAGAYARKLAEDAEWEAGQVERERLAEEARIKAEADWLVYLQSETGEQKKKRERQEEKEAIKEQKLRARFNRSWRNERWAEAEKIDKAAYNAGSTAADKINLGKQVKARSQKLCL